ncbi:MAG TPA: phosphoribosylanthranilate isomerase [Gaiellales bacterium]|nr:phosphoribosylanthranilate isomerase [Gaiellales bacterium]
MADVLVKICGMTRAEDVEAAAAAGAGAVGFIVVPDSPRGISFEAAKRLAAAAPEEVRTVAVYADAHPDPEAWEHFDLVQVYGMTGPVPERTIVGTRGTPPGLLPDGVPLLLDLARDSTPDEAALQMHWRDAASVRAPVILAGSLTPGNVAEAVRTARPWAVDTARGVETAPGIKDHELMRAFVRNAKEAA